MPRIYLKIKVKPNARESKLEAAGEEWVAWLRSPPVDGKANAELIALTAKHFGCAKSAVTIKSGAGARLKLLAIETP